MIVRPTDLEHKLSALRAFGRFPDDVIERLGDALRASSGWDLHRQNPFELAARWSMDPGVAVDLLVHGVRVGLFDLVWSTVCVFCGAVEYTFDSIDRVPRESFRCTRCDVDISSWLDERVEVSFSLHPSVGDLEIDPFADLASYERYYTSRSVEHARNTRDFMARVQRGHLFLPAAGTGELELFLPAGGSLRLFSWDRHAEVYLTAEVGSPSRSEVEVELLAAAFAPAVLGASPGRVRVRVTNRAPVPAGVIALDGDVELFRHEIETRRAQLAPYLTGHMLLCNDSFRSLFRVQTLDEELALNVRHVTVLFTDLARSTQLYESAGDFAAYSLVRAHFRELHEATAGHGGALVKTMGDAIMAVHTRPVDAVRAALEMLLRIEELNGRLDGEGRALGLRIGVHAGPAIVVHAEGRLDYFGQAVNIAARVQALAEAGTLCMTADVRDGPGVLALLSEAGHSIDMEAVFVRGVVDAVHVCRVRPRGRAPHAR